jgi:hypothetical protein
MNVNILAFYISLILYIYQRWNSNTEMINLSFQATVLLGIMTLLNRR